MSGEVQKGFRSGFVAILGPTNAGKSSLLNAILGTKVSIVSARKQTTYHRICGVWNGDGFQVVFVDTPGFQNYQERVARLLNRVADQGKEGCEVALWMFDVSHRGMLREYESLKERIRQTQTPANSLCVLNKVDAVPDKKRLLPIMERLHREGLFSEVIPISVRKNDGLDLVKAAVLGRLKEGPRYFPEDQVTDRSEQFLVTEFIRESVYHSATQEIPYSLRVEIEDWQPPEVSPSSVPIIRAVIHVDSPSRKKILIGRQGSMLKRVGTKARRQIERMLGYQVCLKLFVHLHEDWQSRQQVVREYLELS